MYEASLLPAATYEALYDAGKGAYYLLDESRLMANYHALMAAFRPHYEDCQAAYSYKTNYMPQICKPLHAAGVYAEVVSEMEYHFAVHNGNAAENIFFNGPVKAIDCARNHLMQGGIVNLDSWDEWQALKAALDGQTARLDSGALRLGVRVNFPVNDKPSRFGFAANSDELQALLHDVTSTEGFELASLHCHYAARDAATWDKTVRGMMQVYRDVQKRFAVAPRYVSFGGGLSGPMPAGMQKNLGVEAPDFADYGAIFGAALNDIGFDGKPCVLIEPGTALCGDVLAFVCRVFSVKQIDARRIASVDGSSFNLGRSLSPTSGPIYAARDGHWLPVTEMAGSLDIGGYSCIEDDVMKIALQADLAAGDILVFPISGSYSNVMKAPFIEPDVAYFCRHNGGDIDLVRRRQSWQDIVALDVDV